MTTLLIALHSIVCVVLVFLVLVHSGRDAGLSGAFGVGGSSGTGGSTAVVEKNLDRLTVVAGVALFLTTFALSRVAL